MNDRTGQGSHAICGRIDSRILTHLLLEATDLLEEAQVHTAIEEPTRENAVAMSNATWRLATTCAWVLPQLNAGWGDGSEGERLMAASPMRDHAETVQSEPLRMFLRRVTRLHERACKLHELTSDKARDTAAAPAVPQPRPLAQKIPPVPPRSTAPVVPIVPGQDVRVAATARAEHPVHSAQSRLNWVFSAG